MSTENRWGGFDSQPHFGLKHKPYEGWFSLKRSIVVGIPNNCWIEVSPKGLISIGFFVFILLYAYPIKYALLVGVLGYSSVLCRVHLLCLTAFFTSHTFCDEAFSGDM